MEIEPESPIHRVIYCWRWENLHGQKLVVLVIDSSRVQKPPPARRDSDSSGRIVPRADVGSSSPSRIRRQPAGADESSMTGHLYFASFFSWLSVSRGARGASASYADCASPDARRSRCNGHRPTRLHPRNASAGQHGA